MTTPKTIAKNTFFLILAKVVGMILGLSYVMYVARYLGADRYGVLSFALSFTAISSIILDLGFGILTAREVSRDRSLGNRYLGNILPVKFIVSIIVFGLVFNALNLMNIPQETKLVIYLILIYTILTSYNSLFQSIFQAFQEMKYISIGQILNNLFMFIGGMILIYNKSDVVEFALLYSVVSFVVLGYSSFYCFRKFIKPTLSVDIKFLKKIAPEALPFSATIMISVLFFHTDIVMLSAIKGNEITGLYDSACKIILVIVSFAEVFIYAIFPAASELFLSSKNSLELLLEKSSKYLCILGFPAAFGIILLSNEIIRLIYGDGFIEASKVLQILGLYLPFRFISHATGWTLASINREPLRTLSAAISIGINIMLNLILIPKYDMVGAGIATVISQLVLFTLYRHFVSKYFYPLPLLKIALKPLIASIVMGLFICLIKPYNLFVVITISSIIYFSVLYLGKGFDTEDKKIFHEIISGVS
ncbi:flippase [Methanosarcina sp. T3]|uniref:flippase n=1 Tax=Methanosarcina sp. T3 TaxID=3439062 RepID=UPI003F8673AC